MMESENLAYMSAADLARAIARKKISPVEVVETILERIHRVNPAINAFCTLTEDEARKQARAAEEALMSKKKLGPLHGVPVSIKDMIFTRGIRTTFGSKMHEDLIPTEDDVLVERIKAAGAVILGKTNTCEFGYKSVTDNLIFGTTRNPWNLERTPAGSSGGAAAAVAGGLGPIAVGSDGGGSIRCPASYCGIFGFKPSRGRIPAYPLHEGWETIDRRIAHFGPLTRTVADAALAMDVMGGPDNRDPLSLPGKLAYRSGLKKGIKGLRAAVALQFNGAVVEPEVQRSVETASKIFADLGCRVEEARPDLPFMHETFQRLFAADLAGSIGDKLEEWRDRLDPGLVRLTEIGLSFSAADYSRAQNRVHVFWNALQSFFERYDLLLTPTLPLPPFPLGTDWPREIAGQKVHPLNLLAFTYPFNLTGQPAASIPCGWTGDGLPVGMQIVGRRFEDLTVLRASAAFEEACPWADRRPAL